MKVLLKLTKPGRIVPDPKTGKPIGEAGIEVKLDERGKLPRYFRRRVKDGDLAEAAPVRHSTQPDLSLED